MTLSLASVHLHAEGSGCGDEIQQEIRGGLKAGFKLSIALDAYGNSPWLVPRFVSVRDDALNTLKGVPKVVASVPVQPFEKQVHHLLPLSLVEVTSR